MKTMRRLGYSLGLGAALVMGGNTAMAAGPSVVPDPGDPTTQPHTAYRASGTTRVDWTGKNPKNCDRGYLMFAKNADGSQGELLVHIPDGPNAAGWAQVQKGYDEANQWCSDNSLTCTIITGLGFLIMAPLLSQASGAPAA